jgi:hypothetical protein
MTTITVWLMFLYVHGGWVQAPAMYKTEADCLAVSSVVDSRAIQVSRCIKAEVVKP